MTPEAERLLNKTKAKVFKGHLIRLSDALKRAKKSWPHITERCIRDAVISGAIDSKRTSAAPKAPYMVQWSAVKDYLDGLNRN